MCSLEGCFGLLYSSTSRFLSSSGNDGIDRDVPEFIVMLAEENDGSIGLGVEGRWDVFDGFFDDLKWNQI